MPVRYIDVRPISRLVVPATRAFGNIAIVGQCEQNATAALNVPKAFTGPGEATDPDSAAAQFRGATFRALENAFDQTPGPTVVWAVRVDSTNPDFGAALAEVAKLDVQIVLLANTPLTAGNSSTIDLLRAHVQSMSTGASDGKERIGVAMLAKGATATNIVAGNLINERMVYIAHKSDDDVAAAVAGVIAGHEPHISLLLKRVRVEMEGTFTDAEIDAFNAANINWLTDPVLIPGAGFFMGEGYTGDPGNTAKRFIDVVRTLDDITFRLKASLIEAIGNFRVSRSGLRAVVALVQSVLSPLVAREVIEGFFVHIPLLVMLDKDPNSLLQEELDAIDLAQASRRVDMVVTVDYAGAIHRLRIDLVFK